MDRRSLWITLAVLAVAGIAGWLLWQRAPQGEGLEGTFEEGAHTENGAQAAQSTTAVDLYFPGPSGRLFAERREVPASTASEARIRTLVENLITGPRAAGLSSPLPGEVTVRQVYLMEGNVFLDFETPERTLPPASGSQHELLTVYSLVNTVLLNIEGAERLVLLWNGQQPVTFAGHLNTARPLAVNSDLIARR